MRMERDAASPPAAERRKSRKGAAECIRCGSCEQACPQHIAIRDELARTAGTLLV